MNRHDIERAILAAIIYCDGYVRISNILTYKNFQVVAHADIFRCISVLYPHTPIDIITAGNELSKLDPEGGYNLLINTLSVNVSSAGNLEYWAFILLEMDITEKFRRQVSEWKIEAAGDGHKTTVAVLDEISENIGKMDIFDLIEKVIAYFQDKGLREEEQKALAFNDQLAARVKDIKKTASVKIAVDYLIKTTQQSARCSDQCEKFARVIVDIISTGHTNPLYTRAIETIYSAN